MATNVPPNRVNTRTPNRSIGSIILRLGRFILGLGLLLPVTLYWFFGLLGLTLHTFFRGYGLI